MSSSVKNVNPSKTFTGWSLAGNPNSEATTSTRETVPKWKGYLHTELYRRPRQDWERRAKAKAKVFASLGIFFGTFGWCCNLQVAKIIFRHFAVFAPAASASGLPWAEIGETGTSLWDKKEVHKPNVWALGSLFTSFRNNVQKYARKTQQNPFHCCCMPGQFMSGTAAPDTGHLWRVLNISCVVSESTSVALGVQPKKGESNFF